jgi:hypothetical protein
MLAAPIRLLFKRSQDDCGFDATGCAEGIYPLRSQLYSGNFSAISST